VKQSPKARLLIVDDESDLVTALCRVLEAQGYATTGTTSALQALHALRTAAADDAAKFDVLITDLMMPFMDGIALLREARGIDGDLVSIVMTGQGTIDTAVEAMKGGALDYILKPFDLRVVTPVLLRALVVRRLRRENAALLQQAAGRAAELDAASRELRAARQELQAFKHGVSQEWLQPLDRILAGAESLLGAEQGGLSPAQKEILSRIRRDGARLARLARGLSQGG
jgi:DNA-binding NtrC family response regulator